MMRNCTHLPLSSASSNIAVAVSDGVVTLTGTVKSYAQKLDAEQAVKRVSGVHGIAEELKVELPVLHGGTMPISQSPRSKRCVGTREFLRTQ